MGVDGLVVTFRCNLVLDRCPWSEYKSIGPEATSVVAKAGWSCSELDRIAAFLHERNIWQTPSRHPSGPRARPRAPQLKLKFTVLGWLVAVN
ncbi:hypothetical protein BJX64DRAFT_271831 [Aspergillus heterothallicus]